jgi:hypothetical protein
LRERFLQHCNQHTLYVLQRSIRFSTHIGGFCSRLDAVPHGRRLQNRNGDRRKLGGEFAQILGAQCAHGAILAGAKVSVDFNVIPER